MSFSIFNKLAFSRRIVSTAFTVPHALSDFLASSSPARKVSFRAPSNLVYTLENEPRPPDSVLLATIYQPGQGHQALDFNGGQNWPYTKLEEMQNLVYDISRDYLEKHKGLDNLYFDAMFWKLTSDQIFKDLGVFYKPAPIPDKNEWKASWCREGKPNWLGTIPTKADDHLRNTALIDGFIDEEGGKGGYAVIFIDNYAMPKVAAVGYSPKGSLFLFELQGIRAALQLALDTGLGAGAYIELTTRSEKVMDLFDHLSELEDLVTIYHCVQSYSKPDHGDGADVCLACEGLHLFRHFITETEDFEVLYPVIKEILELHHKLGRHVGVSPNLSQASVYLGKCYGTPTTEEMKLFRLLDGEHELYEMAMKPDNFPEELEDILYDDYFKGYRYYGLDILEERVPGHSQLSAPNVFERKDTFFNRRTDFNQG